ncbi:hypothetical protein FGK63_18145 [Ruegeria sediminis]|uniref:Secreted protein n=1 Tax=Ruegeria sediminis TaxID=2583820 RepID=A0ABY2WT16_9RHOB|nr:hypothetical protein [Ruegeria sediminis]TMV04209.1 hypothetical protein FGK63_18145 [Ruegeria sediminis]
MRHEKVIQGSILPALVFALGGSFASQAMAQDANACPVDGCMIEIVSVQRDGDELTVELSSNFVPDMSKNHFHIWWGELYDVKQVSNNAETVHNVSQGDWHPTDAYPSYITSGVTSVSQRGEAVSLCVSAADRNHDIIDPEEFTCLDVSENF